MNSKNVIKEYDAYLNFCDGSAYVYVKNKYKVKMVYDLICNFSKENNNCIKNIISSEEAKKLGASDKCTFMLEANDNYYFINDYLGNTIEKTKGKHAIANHGYNPKDDNYKTIFFCKAPNVKKNFDIGPIRLIDEGATIFNMLGKVPSDIDGNILNSIFI
ncbi:hypothetical protein [Clostridium thermobutyricum]|uniref:hypothetical protein n=1 Tax=Clostridium thermobutyricum TaxID=29372 RepID=UPI0018AC7A0D|nr:hypothetical protein [Clostridium thermobutyricum]